MEIAKVEMTAVEKADVATGVDLVELVDLQLVLVGGGTGDIHFG